MLCLRNERLAPQGVRELATHECKRVLGDIVAVRPDIAPRGHHRAKRLAGG
jgi:hypothetical protein